MTGSEGNDSWIRDMRVTLLSPIHLTYVLKLEADFEADKSRWLHYQARYPRGDHYVMFSGHALRPSPDEIIH